MAKLDKDTAAHLEWIGFVKPTGLVVSAPALVRAGAILNRYDREGQRLLQQCVKERAVAPGGALEPYLPDFVDFAKTVLDWNFSPKAYAGTEENPIPDKLKVQLPDSSATLQPHYAVRERDSINPSDGYEGPKWQLLVRISDAGEDFDRIIKNAGGIDASPHGVMERLLRQTSVSAGLLFNGVALRLISAPRGENSGWLDFRVGDMVQTAGRPICSALKLLLHQERLWLLSPNQRLTALLADSRKFQNEVSVDLAEQVLHALYELLRGLQAAHNASHGELLRDPLENQPDDVYRAMLTVILRIVFLLYAEERDMLPHEDETFSRHYSIAGLYERLREDAALHPDTMEQRFGAWAQLLVLFRMIHDGAESGKVRLPARRGVLFDPARYKFLEGLFGDVEADSGRIEAPLVPDGTIHRVLEKLLVLKGERISYRALDVEHVGSVYETMMGFRLETATGRSIAIRATKKHGAPTTVNLEELLGELPAKRAKWVRDRTDRKLTDKVGKGVCEADTLNALHGALDQVVDKYATPDLVPRGALVLQPSLERRRSGSHYTPRELTEPIVRKALEPVLERLRGDNGKPPTPEQILDLKVCDPAVGSGAFLVEACRQLGDALVEAWRVHSTSHDISSGEDEIINARRLVARKCLYGVDRNPVAVDLAKLSIWLVTLSRDQPLTFIDHTIMQGDSLVGLSRRQIERFHWDERERNFQEGFEVKHIRSRLIRVIEMRNKIRMSTETTRANVTWRRLLNEVESEMTLVRLYADLIIRAFFQGNKISEWKAQRAEFAAKIWGRQEDELRCQEVPVHKHLSSRFVTFHWEIEFPEVFQRTNPGFDLIVGNPPFLGGKRISSILGTSYRNWLSTIHHETTSNVDLVGHFFRRSYVLIRNSGTFALIATNSIAQGATREGSLRWLCQNGGHIYSALRRIKWPGLAAVTVSIIHITKGNNYRVAMLDHKPVTRINAFLSHAGPDTLPKLLTENRGKSYVGMFLRGSGFIFDNSNNSDALNSLESMNQIIDQNPRYVERIRPYIGGKEVNSSPTHAHDRFVIDFESMSEHRARQYPQLMAIIEKKVRPYRKSLSSSQIDRMHKQYWWQFANSRPELRKIMSSMKRLLVVSEVGQHLGFVFLSTHMIYSHTLKVFSFDSYAAFCVLQSRCHETWARFFGSSLEDRLRYLPTDCFETFPFPIHWTENAGLETEGRTYFEARSSLMISKNEGLTKIYNRFHDPDEDDPRIVHLRELHESMDQAVLNTYGWTDISTQCEFLLDYEIDEKEWGNKKKPYRYRWPDEVRDEVLGRLLELNAKRAAMEKRTRVRSKKQRKQKASPNAGAQISDSLFTS